MHFTRKDKVKKDMSLTRLCFDRGFRKGVTPIPCCSFHPGTIWGILLRSPHLSCIRYCYSHNFFCQLCKLSTSVDGKSWKNFMEKNRQKKSWVSIPVIYFSPSTLAVAYLSKITFRDSESARFRYPDACKELQHIEKIDFIPFRLNFCTTWTYSRLLN